MKRSAVGSLLRTTQAYCIQVCEKQTLEYGIAYCCAQFPGVAEVQQYREIIATEQDTLAQALGEADTYFDDLKQRCLVLAPAEGSASDTAARFFEERGFEKRSFLALALVEWVDISTGGDVRVLPARPMRAALRATFDDPILADLCDLRLNDPQYDMFVAMVDGEPAGRCALYQVGDIARVMDLQLSPTNAGGDVERALLSHVLALARRIEMRNICTMVRSDQVDALRVLTDVGFQNDGEIVEFHRTTPAGSGSHP